MGAADAHCCASMAVFLVYLMLFLQVSAFPSNLNTQSKVQRGVYVSLQLNDWKQAVVGTSGEWQSLGVGGSALVTARLDASLPIAGSIFAGVLLGFLLLMLFISIYACFMAMPEAHWSYLFLEPRFLIILNAALVMLAKYAVQNSFVYCYCPGCMSPAVLCLLFSIFALATCWADIIFIGFSKSLYKTCRMILLLVMGIIPAFASLIMNLTILFKVLAWVVCIASSIISVVDYMFMSIAEKASKVVNTVEETVPGGTVVSGKDDEKIQEETKSGVVGVTGQDPYPSPENTSLFQQFVMKDAAWMMIPQAPSLESKKKHHYA